MKNTVYPANGEGFPPASFWRLGDAMAYCMQMAGGQNNSGVAMCPARSFNIHWSDRK